VQSLAAVVLLAVAVQQAPAVEGPGEEQARAAANRFGAALTKGDAGLMVAVLPAKGKVRTRLGCLAPEEGVFSAGQVQALFSDLLRQCTVREFEITRVDHSPGRHAFIRTEAEIVDREGRLRRVEIHLTLQAEDGRWTLREVRASPP
jgi:hypothetical protein